MSKINNPPPLYNGQEYDQFLNFLEVPGKDRCPSGELGKVIPDPLNSQTFVEPLMEKVRARATSFIQVAPEDQAGPLGLRKMEILTPNNDDIEHLFMPDANNRGNYIQFTKYGGSIVMRTLWRIRHPLGDPHAVMSSTIGQIPGGDSMEVETREYDADLLNMRYVSEANVTTEINQGRQPFFSASLLIQGDEIYTVRDDSTTGIQERTSEKFPHTNQTWHQSRIGINSSIMAKYNTGNAKETIVYQNQKLSPDGQEVITTLNEHDGKTGYHRSELIIVHGEKNLITEITYVQDLSPNIFRSTITYR